MTDTHRLFVLALAAAALAGCSQPFVPAGASAVGTATPGQTVAPPSCEAVIAPGCRPVSSDLMN